MINFILVTALIYVFIGAQEYMKQFNQLRSDVDGLLYRETQATQAKMDELGKYDVFKWDETLT